MDVTGILKSAVTMAGKGAWEMICYSVSHIWHGGGSVVVISIIVWEIVKFLFPYVWRFVRARAKAKEKRKVIIKNALKEAKQESKAKVRKKRQIRRVRG